MNVLCIGPRCDETRNLNSGSVLSRDSGDNGGAINTAGGASLQVSLDSGAGAGIGTGDCQYVRDSYLGRFLLLPHCSQIRNPSRTEPLIRHEMREFTMMRVTGVENMELGMGVQVNIHHHQ